MEYIIAYAIGVAVCIAITYGHSARSIRSGARRKHNHLAMILLSCLSWTGVLIYCAGAMFFKFAVPEK